MSERKGILTKAQEEFLAEVLDAFFKFKNPLIEGFDKTIFRFVLTTLDDVAIDKLKDSWKEKLIKLVDAAILGDVEAVRVETEIILNESIDIPKVGDYVEQKMFEHFTKFLASSVEWYVINKK